VLRFGDLIEVILTDIEQVTDGGFPYRQFLSEDEHFTAADAQADVARPWDLVLPNNRGAIVELVFADGTFRLLNLAVVIAHGAITFLLGISRTTFPLGVTTRNAISASGFSDTISRIESMPDLEHILAT
jgi:hypothetical protein